jgi:hypothetical protein
MEDPFFEVSQAWQAGHVGGGADSQRRVETYGWRRCIDAMELWTKIELSEPDA